MPGTFTAGFTYAFGATVSSANIETLLTNTILSGVDRSDVDMDNFSPVTARALNKPPGVFSKESWYNSLSGWPMVELSSESVPAFGHSVKATLAATSPAVVAGNALQISSYDGTDLTVTICPANRPWAAVCVASKEASPGNVFPVIFDGVVKVRIAETVTLGQGVSGSTLVTGQYRGYDWPHIGGGNRVLLLGTFLQTVAIADDNRAWATMFR